MARIKPQTLLLQSKKKKGPTRISLTTIIMCNLLVVVLVLSLVATYRHYSHRGRNLEENGFENNQVEDSKTFVDLKKFDLPNFAVSFFDTCCLEAVCRLTLRKAMTNMLYSGHKPLHDKEVLESLVWMEGDQAPGLDTLLNFSTSFIQFLKRSVVQEVVEIRDSRLTILVCTTNKGLLSLMGNYWLGANEVIEVIRGGFRSSELGVVYGGGLGSSSVYEGSISKVLKVHSTKILNTSKGLITVELYKEASPEIVDSFLDLCQKGHFKGMLFQRVIKNYVIQAGDFQRLGAAEDWTSKSKPHGQFPNSLKHEAFMLGTSKAKHDTKGFELFITTAPIPDLNDKLIVFGRVIKGEDVVQEIEEVDTDERYRPKSPIGIINVTLRHEL
ncbi:hypothetical protein IFM89_009595 [Coptis chinensis]|uniref:peptidylprolyl isomerase n=1 Tax=Coptis chinensis TaxID=261450 RepID=A0A835IMD4_9MAGN|nr:hypothetical protein IFM89_009595 [Coptis chinensis]